MSFIPLKVGTLCSFSFMEFNIDEDPPINMDNFKLEDWPLQFRKYNFFIVLKVLNKDRIYKRKRHYTTEKHQPYLCYSLDDQKNYICLHGELKELQ